jgi:hypothetical protein
MATHSKNLLSLFVLFIFVVLAVASSGTKNITFTKEGGQVPPEFNQFKDTLLVIGHANDWGYNKYLKKNFEENYTGSYKIITPKEIPNYSPERYRYIFDHNLNYSTRATDGKSYASSDVFYITDRKINKDYVTKSSAYYSKLMKAYIKALDLERQK